MRLRKHGRVRWIYPAKEGTWLWHVEECGFFVGRVLIGLVVLMMFVGLLAWKAVLDRWDRWHEQKETDDETTE